MEGDTELDRFRKQWQAEVQAKKGSSSGKTDSSSRSNHARTQSKSNAGPSNSTRPAGPPKTKSTTEPKQNVDQAVLPDLPGGGSQQPADPFSTIETKFSKRRARRRAEPETALELYEAAVEHEDSGKLGPSLDLYRKAHKMDPDVDKAYKNKHFPDVPPSGNIPEAAPVEASQEKAVVLPIDELIASLAECSIVGAPPMIERDIPPPCPIADVPSEILLQIMSAVAETDIVSFVRLAQVCKRFAYIVSMGDLIWKNVCLGENFGLTAMRHEYACGILGDELPVDHRLHEDHHNAEDDHDAEDEPHIQLKEPDYPALCSKLYSASYRQMFHDHPRIRFKGLYIATANYIRAGGASATQVTWNAPYHIVTYYRYLRFFRDGTVMSLLTTDEPAVVVPIFTRETPSGGDVPMSHPLHYVLRGRWRIAPPSKPAPGPENDKTYINKLPHIDVAVDSSETALDEIEVETEGPNGGIDKYMFRMRLAIKNTISSSRSQHKSTGAKSTKLAWKGFWSYNCVSDDWSVFSLRNDRSFVWVKVGAWTDA